MTRQADANLYEAKASGKDQSGGEFSRPKSARAAMRQPSVPGMQAPRRP